MHGMTPRFGSMPYQSHDERDRDRRLPSDPRANEWRDDIANRANRDERQCDSSEQDACAGLEDPAGSPIMAPKLGISTAPALKMRIIDQAMSDAKTVPAMM
jgi:hypothetical protein